MDELFRDRGIYTEYLATYALEKEFKRKNWRYKLYNNMVIPKPDGNFNEIDIVVACEKGLFVTEVKGKAGIIEAFFLDDTWVQHIGSQKHNMQNPFKQNRKHINWLLKYIYTEMEKDKIDPQKYSYYVEKCVTNLLLIGNETGLTRKDTIGELEENWRYARIDSFNLDDYDLTPYSDLIFEYILKILDGVPVYSAEERSKMFYEREVKANAGAFKHKTKYAIAKDRCGWQPYVIIKDDGYIQTVSWKKDYVFRYGYSEQYKEEDFLVVCNNFEDAVAKLNEIENKND